MRRVVIAGGVVVGGLILLAVAVTFGSRAAERERDLAGTASRERDFVGTASRERDFVGTASREREAVAAPARRAEELGGDGGAAAADGSAARSPESYQGFLSGRVITTGGDLFEGRLRWGGGEEAFWGDYFNGVKVGNPWVAHVPPERLPRERRPFAVFGLEILERQRPLELGRPFMARFGDLARIDAEGRDVRVTLKSGTEIVLDRFEASDFDDGVRVWDPRRGVVDLGPRRIRAIELLPASALGEPPGRLHGTVRTAAGEFTGFVQWEREKCLGSDELVGRTAEGEVALRFDTVRAVARQADESLRVSLVDGRELVLSGGGRSGPGPRGVYVDDPRYGRVLISRAAFERLDLAQPGAAGSGPAYGDFPPGRPLTGVVTTRDGRRLAGRLVYDLDESETTETLDAPARGVDYTLPFGGIAAVDLGGGSPAGARLARVTLRSGEELELERAGDLGANNAGLLVFLADGESAEYVPWPEVLRIDLDRPDAAQAARAR